MTMVKPYRWLAEYYDRMIGVGRGPMVAARRRILRSVMPEVASACDLACGTGDTAIEFARAGLRVYATDLSPGMCRAAREKARRAKATVRVIRADMRSFRLPEPVDLITCECDALNHVARRADLRAVVRRVSRALRPGGRFFFDVNNVLGFESYWKGAWCRESAGLMLIIRSGHRGARAWSDVDWFIRNGNGWRRHSERVEEVAWTAAQVERELRAAGFDRVQSWDAAPLLDIPEIGPGCRTFYLARKAPAIH